MPSICLSHERADKSSARLSGSPFQLHFSSKNPNLMKPSLIILFAVVLTACSAFSVKADSPPSHLFDPAHPKPTELPAGSKLRAELFDQLRKKTDSATRFQGSLKVFRNWAFFSGRTVDKAGKSIKHPPMDNDDAVGLWLRTRDGWMVVNYDFGHSDAFFVVWPEQYGVPRALLGLK